jgi:hypothetical protein
MNAAQSIAVKNTKTDVNENRTITLEVQIDSPELENITILIATDRFTKVYKKSLSSGPNKVTFEFDYIVDSSWYEAGGLYWLHLAQARVVIIEDGSVVYDRFTTTQDLRSVNFLLLILLLAILVVYSVLQIKYRNTC